MEKLVEIEKLAPVVAQEYTDHKAAVSAERDAEAAVLTRAIELAKPALRAVSERIVSSSADTGGANGCNPVAEKTYFTERGLVLVSHYEMAKDSTGNGGRFVGERLYLLTDGRLAITEQSGSWSAWQGAWNRKEVLMRFVSVREAMDEWDLDDCLTAIAKALREQAGKRDAKAPRERAEKLAALVKLV